jgi:hypothetical protein
MTDANLTPNTVPTTPTTPTTAEVNVGATPQMFKVKVDGADQEVALDDLIRGYSKATGAEKKFQEANMKNQQVKEFLNLLKTNPMKVLQDPNLGLDFRKLAQDYLYEEATNSLMSPEQRKAAQAQRELEQYKQREAEERNKIETAKRNELVQKEFTRIDTEVSESLSKLGLPKTKYNAQRTAYYMMHALQNGYEITAGEAAQQVYNDYIEDNRATFTATDPEMIIKLLGNEIVDKIRKADLSKIRQVGNVKNSVTRQTIDNKADKTKTITTKQFRKMFDR